jgi:hypothetical protein
VTDVLGFLEIQKEERSEQVQASDGAARAAHDG